MKQRILASSMGRGNAPNHNREPLIFAKGNTSDCSRLGKRVKSATCADGCVTAASAANRQVKSRGRTILLRCSPSFPIPSPTKTEATAVNPTLKLSPSSPRHRRLSLWPRPAAEMIRRNNGGTETAAVAAVAAAIDSRRPRSLWHSHPRKIWRAHPRFLIRAAQLAKPPRRER